MKIDENVAPVFSDALVSDFDDRLFQKAFKTYFDELDIRVQDWDSLFREMNDGSGNRAFVRTACEGGIIGFVLFEPVKFTSWFFEETCGFIREFWVAGGYRSAGHGAALLSRAEDHFREQGICTCILTTDTAERFYLRHGYVYAPGCIAKNGDKVYIKRLA